MAVSYYQASDYFNERLYPGEPIVEETDFMDARSFGEIGEHMEPFEIGIFEDEDEDEDDEYTDYDQYFWESLGNN